MIEGDAGEVAVGVLEAPGSGKSIAVAIACPPSDAREAFDVEGALSRVEVMAPQAR